jgi:glycosyltransferase involved in cell wall biosynthesis
MKRQRVLVEAARHLRSGMRIIIAGRGSGREIETLERIAVQSGTKDRIRFAGEISVEEKLDLYARCSAVFFGAYNEDLGYIPLEAFLAHKPVLTLPDAGEALQFVRDGENGYIVSGQEELAARLDGIAADPSLAMRLGECGFRTMRSKNISWDAVVESLTGAVHA